MVRYLGTKWEICEGIEQELELFVRHISILNFVVKNQPIGISRISNKLGIPTHRVRYSLRILEREGLIVPTHSGAITTSKCKDFYEDLSETLEKYIQVLSGIKAGINNFSKR